MVKVFMVDDEIVIREGVRNSFPWEENGYTLVGEAPDGEIALPMIRDEKPDILITDIRMPFMDGMQLCREVKRLMPWIGIVILSGYDDFAYAREAITLGVKEYLLKPISARELKDALDRISQKLREERATREQMENMQRRLAGGNRFVREKLLASLFADDPEEGSARRTVEQMRALGVNLMAGSYAVLDIAFSDADGGHEAGRTVLLNLAEGSGGSVQMCPAKNGARALVMGDDETDTEERAYSFVNSAVYELERSGAKDVLCTVGEIVTDAEQIYRSMRSARHIRHVVMGGDPRDRSMRIVGVREMGDPPAALPDLNLQPLHEQLQYIDIHELPRVFSGYVASLGSAEVAMDYLRVEALMAAGRIVSAAGGDPQKELMGYEVTPEDGGDTYGACQGLLQKALRYRDEHSPLTGNSSIARARSYLARRFTDPNLMLQDVAKEVCMSGSRFSTVFAQETGFTFTEYLTALRLGKAKELLSATGMRSSQIAFAVGYNDPHYFSYMFKKNTGLTPGEYRKQNQN